MMPMGTRAMPMKRISRSNDRIISDFFAPGWSFACRESWAASLASPTAVSSARPRPETTKEPEWRMSPGCFSTLSASPVSKDSSAHRAPSRKTASAQIWSPCLNSAMSSRTTSSGGTELLVPSRITVTGRRATRAS